MTSLVAGTVTDAGALALAQEPLPAESVVSGESGVSGAPTTGIRELGIFGDVELGVWEMTPGVATDTEADEVFVVLSGRARIVFDEPALPPIEVGPGSVVRLAEGMRTTWIITETLRKVYLVKA